MNLDNALTIHLNILSFLNIKICSYTIFLMKYAMDTIAFIPQVDIQLKANCITNEKKIDKLEIGSLNLGRYEENSKTCRHIYLRFNRRLASLFNNAVRELHDFRARKIDYFIASSDDQCKSHSRAKKKKALSIHITYELSKRRRNGRTRSRRGERMTLKMVSLVTPDPIRRDDD